MAEPDLLEEAADATTNPERLRELSYHENLEVRRAVWRNPSVPEDLWRRALILGESEAWANPMAPIYLLAWTPREDDFRTLVEAAHFAIKTLWTDPERCSSEGKAMIASKVQEGWDTSEDPEDMMRFLGWWARAKGNGSSEHHEVVRILVRCVRTAPDLTDGDHLALDLLEAWTAGGQDLRKRAKTLASSKAVDYTMMFAVRIDQEFSSNPWSAIFEVFEAVEGVITAGSEARSKHSRLLADLIRGAMPLPPVVD